jgi:hypothetical protein
MDPSPALQPSGMKKKERIMKARIWRWSALALVLGVLMITALSPAGAASGSARLTPAEEDALRQAIDEEYLALTTYQAVIKEFGDVSPFSNIVLSEEQHVAALSQLFVKYGMEIPKDDGDQFAYEWASFSDACKTGVAVEIDDIDLYDELLPTVQNKRDLTRVFTNVQAASYNHLAAFQACD